MIENLFIDIKPLGKGRPRFSKTGVYTPSETAECESIISWIVSQRMRQLGKSCSNLCIEMILIFCMKKPAKAANNYPKKPDIDNMAKLVMDALNGIAYKDDGQVVSLKCEKMYADKEGILIYINEIDKGDRRCLLIQSN